MGTISLSDALTGAPKSRGFRVDELLESDELSKEDRATFAAAVRDPNVKPGRLEAAMSTIEVTCSGNAVTNWRRANGITKAT